MDQSAELCPNCGLPPMRPLPAAPQTRPSAPLGRLICTYCGASIMDTAVAICPNCGSNPRAFPPPPAQGGTGMHVLSGSPEIIRKIPLTPPKGKDA